MRTCEGCSEYYHLLKTWEREPEKTKGKDGKAALKKIKGKIKMRRLLTALVTAVLVAALMFGIFHRFVLHETYIPYEESGLYVADDAIRSERNYYKSTGLYSPDGESLFLFMTTTAYVELCEKDGLRAGTPIIALDEKSRTMQMTDDEGHVTKQVCREIYYVPEKTAKQYMRVMKWTSEGETEEEVEELKEASVLLWSDEPSRR